MPADATTRTRLTLRHLTFGGMIAPATLASAVEDALSPSVSRRAVVF